MQNIAKFVNTAVYTYLVDSSQIQWIQARIGFVMKPNGWVLLVMSNRECIILQFNHGSLTNQGYVVNDEKVLKVIGNHQIGDISYDEQSTVVEGIVDLDHGSRFEGLILAKDKLGIPFGYGEMYDDNGLLLYKGIMINWKRFGYGTSYHDNGLVEYEGYWCDDNRFGSGKVFDRSGKFVKECKWVHGIESDNEDYEGDGSEPLNIEMKHLKLTDRCKLAYWNVSLFYCLESIEIGNNCFGSVLTFKIDGLNRLKTIRIGINSFTEKKNGWGNKKSKSFHILNCESLESIQIGEYSFSDFGGKFEMKNLPQLQSIQIGKVGSKSCNFYCKSFEIEGTELILNMLLLGFPNLLDISIGDQAFRSSTMFGISNLSSLYRLEIGSDCFSYVKTFKLDGLNNLSCVKIGTNSFTEMPENCWNIERANNTKKSFHIMNCAKLRSIIIDRYSFSDFGGQFQLRNLNSLITIKIGSHKGNAHNFLWSSFILRGYDKGIRMND